jgi:hypothetical protein
LKGFERNIKEGSSPNSPLEKCKWCEKDKRIPCMNTRDMEEAAEGGNRECFYQLCRAGGGERGPTSIIMMCEKRENGDFE